MKPLPNSSAPCGHFTGKHHYQVVAWISGSASILKCAWTLCQKHLVISHEDIVERVAA
ncbi:hypothetical protein SEA_QUADZERO_36 [Microbacterium phage QuadZero]|nr:hypothetical protein SEA_QUADZERO_36 [Microbacterium phage QuadZero]